MSKPITLQDVKDLRDHYGERMSGVEIRLVYNHWQAYLRSTPNPPLMFYPPRDILTEEQETCLKRMTALENELKECTEVVGAYAKEKYEELFQLERRHV
jgi:hypothetical protein